MSKVIDLHMHTYFSSDGEYSPEELMHKVHEAGLRIVAIADHNTAGAFVEAKPIADALGIELIPAIELDAIHAGRILHILGYNIDPQDEAILANEHVVREREAENSVKLIEKVEALGIQFERAEVYELSMDGIVVAEMIAEVALNDPRNDAHPLLEELRPGKSRGDNPYVNFYWDICSQGKPAFVPMDYISLEEAVALIRKAGGVPVFAHPGNNIGMDRSLALEIMGEGLAGIEAYSSYHDEETTKFYVDLARELDVFVTVGSDFHGKNKPAIVPGGVDVDDEAELIEAFSRQLETI